MQQFLRVLNKVLGFERGLVLGIWNQSKSIGWRQWSQWWRHRDWQTDYMTRHFSSTCILLLQRMSAFDSETTIMAIVFSLRDDVMTILSHASKHPFSLQLKSSSLQYPTYARVLNSSRNQSLTLHRSFDNIFNNKKISGTRCQVPTYCRMR